MDEGIFVGYSWNSKAYRCYKLRLKRIVESINVKIDESSLIKTKKDILEDQIDIELKQEKEEEEEEEQQVEKKQQEE